MNISVANTDPTTAYELRVQKVVKAFINVVEITNVYAWYK